MLESQELNPAAILVIVLVCVLTVPVLAWAPGAIARKRAHANAATINLLGWFGLLCPPCWMFALFWACTGPDPNTSKREVRGFPVETVNVIVCKTCGSHSLKPSPGFHVKCPKCGGIVAVCLLCLSSLTPLARADGDKPLPRQFSLVGEFERLGLTPRDQGHRDTCSIFAVTSLLEFESGHNTPMPHPRLSEEYLVWAAREVSGKAREQAMFFEITEAINRQGICTTAEMPYAEAFDPNRNPSAKAVAENRSFRDRWRAHWIRRWALHPALTNQQLKQTKQALADGHPVAIGLRWPKAKGESKLLAPPPPREVFDGHSVALVGYEDDPAKPGGGAFVFRNSFGPNWGDHGYGIMSYAYARMYANDILWLECGPPNSEAPLYRFEAESMRQLASQHCTAGIQQMDQWEAPLWSGGKQLFCGAQRGGSVELALQVPRAGRYRIRILATAAPDFGIMQVELKGAGASAEFDLYAGQVCPTGPLELGAFDLPLGEHRFLFTAVQKNTSSKGYYFGIDAIDFAAASRP